MAAPNLFKVKRRRILYVPLLISLVCLISTYTHSVPEEWVSALALIGGASGGLYLGFIGGVEAVFKVAKGRNFESEHEKNEVLDAVFDSKKP